MNSKTIENHQRRPGNDEFGEYFAGYVAKVDGDNILDLLDSQNDELQKILASIDEQKASEIQPPFIWTIKQVVGHLIDGEKVFGYRLHRFASNDQQELPGFDHNYYVDNMDYSKISMVDLSAELAALRRANSLFLRRLSPECWDRSGTASDTKFTVRALAFIIVGHINHHLAIIRQRLED